MKIKRNLLLIALVLVMVLHCVLSQQRGAYNFAKKTGGERDGDLTPSAIAGVSIACVGAVGGLAVTMFFCYYVHRQQKNQESINSSFDPARRI